MNVQKQTDIVIFCGENVHGIMQSPDDKSKRNPWSQLENKKFKNRLQIPIDNPGIARYYGHKEN